MIDAVSEPGRELLRRLLAMHPEWADGLEEGRPGDHWADSVATKLQIPSEHPTIRTPLTIELNGTLQLFWNSNYFFDFIGDDQVSDAWTFLQRFFAEEVRCGLRWRTGEVTGGGPVEDDDVPWLGEYDYVEIRSWRGNRDERTVSQ